MKFRAAWALAAVLPVFAGCHVPLRMPWHHGPHIASCYKPQPYINAESIPPLKVPQGLDSPDNRNALVVPERAIQNGSSAKDALAQAQTRGQAVIDRFARTIRS